MKVDDSWSIHKKNMFIDFIKTEIGKYYDNSIVDCKLIKRKKLYGFDAGREYKFIVMKFRNTQAMNKVKNLFYENVNKERKLKPNGFIFANTNIELYEANIPPLLRFFHIKNISPSGWISIPYKKAEKHSRKITNCDFEYTTSYRSIVALNDLEINVPLKICSFDIEASSSHGDFPLAVKTYKKLVTNIMDYWLNEEDIETYTTEQKNNVIRIMIKGAFGYNDCDQVDKVYPKRPPSNEHQVDIMIENLLSKPVRSLQKQEVKNSIQQFLVDTNDCGEDEEGHGNINIT